MPVDGRMQAQARLVLDRHEGAAAHPAPDQWEDADDLHYLYREYAILVRADRSRPRHRASYGGSLTTPATETSPRATRGRSGARRSAGALSA